MLVGKPAGYRQAVANHCRPLTKPDISVSSPVTDNRYGAEVTLTVTLGPTLIDRTGLALRHAVSAGRASWWRPGLWTPSASGTCGTRSPGPPRSPPSSPGDAYNAANSASLTLDAYARVADWLTGAYKTSKNSDGRGLRRLPRHRHAHLVLDGGAEQARRVP